MKAIDIKNLESITGGNTATPGMITGQGFGGDLGRRAGEEIGRRAGSIWDQLKKLPSPPTLPTFPTPMPNPLFPGGDRWRNLLGR